MSGSIRALTALSPLVLLLAGCGWASATGAALLDDDDDNSPPNNPNAATAISEVTVTRTRTSPATIEFILIDPESDPADVEILFSPPGFADLVAAELVPGEAGEPIDTNLSGLAASPNGTRHVKRWDFGSQVGDGFQGGFTFVVRLSGEGRVGSKPGAVTVTDNVSLGNDAAEVLEALAPDPNVGEDDPSANVDVSFAVSDSSRDPVSIMVEFFVVEEGSIPTGQPCVPSGWSLARPAGIPLSQPTPEFAFTTLSGFDNQNIIVETFVWDTLFDLPDGFEGNVILRFRAHDGVVLGDCRRTDPFRVDNNARPIAILQNDLFVVNPDRRGGIPIPFVVIDEENDPTLVVFQWKIEGQEFPSLPLDPNQAPLLRGLLADPEARREKQIAAEFPVEFVGQPVAPNPPDGDGQELRFPELASSAAQLVVSHLVGRDVEILRSSGIPTPVSPLWPNNPLVTPVCALPVGDGRGVLVLDSPIGGAWRLREIELASGSTRDIAAGAGVPCTMAYERGNESVLVATDASGRWELRRLELSDPVPQPSFLVSAPIPTGPVRGLASLGRNVALITVGDTLFRLHYGHPRRPVIVPLLNLHEPWGIAVDPLHAGRIYVAERNAPAPGNPGRVLAIDLDTRTLIPLAVRGLELPGGADGVAGFPRPEALTLERAGSRLLVVTDAGRGKELRGVDFGGGPDREVFRIATIGTGRVGNVSTGPDGLRIVARPDSDDLLVGGGLEQIRRIESYDPEGQVITVTDRFIPELDRGNPPLATARRWRIRTTSRDQVIPEETQANTPTFVWDSDDVKGEERVIFRVIPIDTDIGFPSLGGIAKDVASPFTQAHVLSDLRLERPQDLETVDLDGDGDIDLVSANSNSDNVTIFFQNGLGQFLLAEPLFDPSTAVPVSVEAADLDSDGDLDLVAANAGSNALTVFFQTSFGQFRSPPMPVELPGVEPRALSVDAGDLDGDGDFDLVAAVVSNREDSLALFCQNRPGAFGSPQTLVVPGLDSNPRSVRTADLEGDGDLDLVAAANTDVLVFRQTSRGDFVLHPVVPLGPTVGNPQSVELTDVNGDGHLDLISVNSLNVSIFHQSHTGAEFTLARTLEGANVLGLQSVDAQDLDADGDIDLVAANVAGDNLPIFIQTMSGEFQLVESLPGAADRAVVNDPFSVKAADIDGDADLDIVSTNSDSLTVFLRTRGKFVRASAPLSDATVPPTFVGPRSVVAADLDGDGDLDLATANSLSDNLHIFAQTVPGQFTADPSGPLDDPSIDAPQEVAAADLDGDGRLDLISANSVSDNLTIFFGEAGGFTRPAEELTHPQGAGARSVEVADLNGDGRFDLASANSNSDNLTVLIQTEFGTFTATHHAPLGPVDEPRSIKAADLNGDGRPDLVSANTSADNVTVFFQTAAGQFHPEPLLLDAVQIDSPQDVEAADLDGDGDLDLVSANSFLFSDSLRIFFQQDSKPGTFVEDPHGPLRVQGDAVVGNPRDVEAADFDEDGDLDLVSANSGSNTLTVFLQTSPGRFRPDPAGPLSDPTAVSPQSVLTADFDADGDLDLAAANASSNTVTIFYGGR